jgi:hypothetical protein
MKYVIIAGVVIITIFILILTTIPIGIEPLTEVYFENHTSLPANLFLNRDYNFTFTVRNLEYKEMTYNYSIKAEYPNVSRVIATDTFTLADNESKSFYHEFSFKERFERAKIKIEVTKDNEEVIDIHFWADQIVPLRITKVNETLNSTQNSTPIPPNNSGPIVLKNNLSNLS